MWKNKITNQKAVESSPQEGLTQIYKTQGKTASFNENLETVTKKRTKIYLKQRKAFKPTA